MPDLVADVEQVRTAFRLGWAVSELRGRYRPERFIEPVPFPPGHQRFTRPVHELPLSIERSPDEKRIEILKVLQGLAASLELSEYDGVARALGEVTESAPELGKEGADVAAGWPDFANDLYSLDAQLQDALAVRGSQAAAYQLGRGLADTYWALHPDRPQDQMGSWSNVLGPERCDALVRQASNGRNRRI